MIAQALNNSVVVFSKLLYDERRVIQNRISNAASRLAQPIDEDDGSSLGGCVASSAMGFRQKA